MAAHSVRTIVAVERQRRPSTPAAKGPSLGDIAPVGATLPSGSRAQSFVWELVMTFLMFAIMAVATDTRAVTRLCGARVGQSLGARRFLRKAKGPVSGAFQ